MNTPPPRFASLDALEHAARAVGDPGAARRAVSDWLKAAWARVGDRAFAQRFAGHFAAFDAPPEAYAHRAFPLSGAPALGGIRFYGGDRARPFVELIAWDAAFDAARFRDEILTEWRAFAPTAFRVLTPSDADADAASGGRLDQTVHAARVDQMAPPQGGVALTPLEDVGDAARTVDEMFQAFAERDPALAREVYAATADDLAETRRGGTLHAITVDGARAGLLATIEGEAAFFRGQVVLEEIVAPAYRGRGLAAEAQRLLARALAAQSLAQETPAPALIGTIHANNHASRRSAERAGRPARLAYRFHPDRP